MSELTEHSTFVRKLAIGNESFRSMREKDCYYVDKTAFIKPVMTSDKYVQIITRPRRFGKSLFLDTLRTFLDLNPVNPDDVSRQEKLFAGLNVRDDEDFCRRFMGKSPVLFINFKGVEGPGFNWAFEVLGLRLAELARRYSWLLQSSRLTEQDKADLRRFGSDDFMTNTVNQIKISTFPARMSGWLAAHFERPVVLLIDEYDVPLQKAASHGYYPAMLAFFKAFLGPLKSAGEAEINGIPAISKAVLTGCLRVSKASIFTDVNNFDVNSVCMQGGPLASAIGFTASEVDTLLTYYGLTSKKSIVQTWYDGYRFGRHDIYCPWDVIHFCADILEEDIDRNTFQPENYWIDTSSNEVIDEFLGFLTKKDADRMQALMDGGTVEFEVNEQLTYGDLADHNSEDFWTLLLFSGYLTLVSKTDTLCEARIPNEEIRRTFSRRILERFSKKNRRFAQSSHALVEAAFTGNTETLKEELSKILKSYISVRDTATKANAENYYHGFLLALLAGAGDAIDNLESNREAGDGYADLIFTSENGAAGVVIELKHNYDMEKAAHEALAQIESKQYVRGLARYGCRRYFGYGIAFSGKSCAVVGEALSPADV